MSPKSGTLKSPPKGLETTNFCKTYYNVVREMCCSVACNASHVEPVDLLVYLCAWSDASGKFVLHQHFPNQIDKYTTNPVYSWQITLRIKDIRNYGGYHNVIVIAGHERVMKQNTLKHCIARIFDLCKGYFEAALSGFLRLGFRLIFEFTVIRL